MKTIPAQVQDVVKGVASYDIDPKTLSSLGGHRERVLSLAKHYDPSYDQKNYRLISDAVTRFATGPQGNVTRSLNVAIEHIDTARRLGDALQNKDIPAFNRLAQAFAEQ